MALTPRRLLLASLVCTLAALAACRSTLREVDLGSRGTACLPPLEAPSPVGTEVGETATRDFILRIHDVRDILDLLPWTQRVGPCGTRTLPAADALVARLLATLSPQERSITDLHVTDSGAFLVKAPPALQQKVALAIHEVRTELVRRQVGTLAMPPEVPVQTPTDAPADPRAEAPPGVTAATPADAPAGTPGDAPAGSPAEASTEAAGALPAEAPQEAAAEPPVTVSGDR